MLKFQKISVLILVNFKNQILLQERIGSSKLGEKYASFGGKSKKGESKEQTLEREILEELGMKLYKSEYRFIGKAYHFYGKRLLFQKVNYFFMKSDIQIKDLNILEGSGAKYFSLEELNSDSGFILKGRSLEKFKKMIRSKLSD